jgi:hypothetical protein
MTDARVFRPRPAPATPPEPVTASRRTREDSPYAHNHAAFPARVARAPPPLLGTGPLR